MLGTQSTVVEVAVGAEIDGVAFAWDLDACLLTFSLDQRLVSTETLIVGVENLDVGFTDGGKVSSISVVDKVFDGLVIRIIIHLVLSVVLVGWVRLLFDGFPFT